MKKWIINELATGDLGDKRLMQRMKLILERLTETPMGSIKAAFKGWSEVVGAYRFFNNKKTCVDGILKPHQDATLKRIKEFERVIFVQDTTEIDYTPKKKLEGTGPLSTIHRQGFFAHNQLVITPERLPLGVWGTTIYARDEADHGKSDERKLRPIEEKESFRWLQGYKDACQLKERAPEVVVIACGDRENDIYEVYQEWNQRKAEGKVTADFLIRCSQNRALKKENNEKGCEERTTYRNIIEKIYASQLLGEFTLHVKKKMQSKKVKKSRKMTLRSARDALMEVRSTQVTLRPPYRKGNKLSEVTFFVVMVKEKEPPKGEDAIEWVLLTSLDSTDYQNAMEIVEMYAARWEIEVFHRVLKTGCKIEELQLKKGERTKVAIALYMIVAWRVMYITMLGRKCPTLPCDAVFEEDEWQAFWVIVHDGHPDALLKKPQLGKFIEKVAEFGGFIGRKCDGHPGHQDIWQGLVKVRHFTEAWLVFVKKEGFKAYHNTS